MPVSDRNGRSAPVHRTAGAGLQLLVALVFAFIASGAAWARQPAIAFDILRNGDVIGSHTVAFEDAADGQRIVVDIAIAVKLLGITVYRYAHRNQELWRDGRLVSIETSTNNDGTPDFVRGRAVEGVLRVEGSRAKHDLPPDTPSTNYWNTDLLRRTVWLNSQTGELMKVTVTPMGEEDVPIPGGTVRAFRHAVAGDLNIDLWYGPGGEWVKCTFKARDGSLIEYRRR